ncbi:hypothetical protein SUGI_0379900 [Cryptomeria japonica]|nr:hypothetical protein SUGI_0379900 [Cryptomeria japonica]
MDGDSKPSSSHDIGHTNTPICDRCLQGSFIETPRCYEGSRKEQSTLSPLSLPTQEFCQPFDTRKLHEGLQIHGSREFSRDCANFGGAIALRNGTFSGRAQIEGAENLRHFCKLCERQFACGRALSAHMKIHSNSEKSNPKVIGIEAAMNGWCEAPVQDGRELKKRSNDLAYALRRNRKRSWVLTEHSGSFLTGKLEDAWPTLVVTSSRPFDECEKEFVSPPTWTFPQGWCMGSSTGGGVNAYTMLPPTITGNSSNTTVSPCMFNQIQRTHWMSAAVIFLASVDTFTKVVEAVKIASRSEEEKKTGMSTTNYTRFQVPILEEECLILASDSLCEDATVLIGYAEEAVKLVSPIPEGTYDRIAPRSGLTWKHSIAVGAKVIDADYRGLVAVIPFNHAHQDFQVYGGERITQLIIVKNKTGSMAEVATVIHRVLFFNTLFVIPVSEEELESTIGVLRGDCIGKRFHKYAHLWLPNKDVSARKMAVAARDASRRLQGLSTDERQKILRDVADALEANKGLITTENEADVAVAQVVGIPESLISRLAWMLELRAGQVISLIVIEQETNNNDPLLLDMISEALHYYSVNLVPAEYFFGVSIFDRDLSQGEQRNRSP